MVHVVIVHSIVLEAPSPRCSTLEGPTDFNHLPPHAEKTAGISEARSIALAARMYNQPGTEPCMCINGTCNSNRNDVGSSLGQHGFRRLAAISLQ